MPSRRWLVCGLALGVALEVYALVGMPHARVRGNGKYPVALMEFGAGAPIVQGFTMQNDGLHSVRVKLSSSAEADLTLECRLSMREEGRLVEQARTSVRISRLSGVRWQTFESPVIASSTGREFVVELRADDVRSSQGGARPDVSLMATRDRPLRQSYLIVDGRERWGALVFEARAIGDTILGRFRLRGLPQLPAALQRMWWVLAAVVLYNAMLIALMAGIWREGHPGSEDPGLQDRESGLWSPGPSGPGASRTARVLPSVLVLLLLGAIVALVAIVRAERAGTDLIDELHEADLQSSLPLHGAFDVFDVDIGADRRRAILAHPTSRIAWHVTVPPRGRLEAAVGMDPAAWRPETDGVVFRISAVESGKSTELFYRHVNPHLVVDQRWIPVGVDLSRFAGRAIELILATEPSLPGHAPDTSHDWALWGAPKIR